MTPTAPAQNLKEAISAKINEGVRSIKDVQKLLGLVSGSKHIGEGRPTQAERRALKQQVKQAAAAALSRTLRGLKTGDFRPTVQDMTARMDAVTHLAHYTHSGRAMPSDTIKASKMIAAAKGYLRPALPKMVETFAQSTTLAPPATIRDLQHETRNVARLIRSVGEMTPDMRTALVTGYQNNRLIVQSGMAQTGAGFAPIRTQAAGPCCPLPRQQPVAPQAQPVAQ